MPQPVPDEELKARGTYRKARHADRPKSDGIRPEMPPGLTAEARRVWEATVVRLETMKIVDTIDAEYLAQYCQAAADLRESRQERNRLKEALARAKKSRARDAAAKVAALQREIKQASIDYRAAMEGLYKAGDRLAIGPIGRARVKVDAGQKQAGEGGKGRFFKPKVAEGT